MDKLNKDIQQKISDQIKDIEKQTSSELVCLITKRSAHYIFFPLIIAAALALLLPFFHSVFDMLGLNLFTLTFHIQALFFLITSAVLLLTPLKLYVTPRKLVLDNCNRFCFEQFFRQRIHDTNERSGILFFVSWEEKFVNIVADKGINKRVEPEVWQEIVDNFVSHIKQNELELGFSESLKTAGELLIKNFPAQKKNEDEIPNHLIEIEDPVYVS